MAERRVKAIVVEASGDTLMVTPEELEAGKALLRAVEAGLAAPRHIAENVKNTSVSGKLYWSLEEGGPNEFQGVVLFTPEGDRFFLSPEAFLRAKERYDRFTAGARNNEASGK